MNKNNLFLVDAAGAFSSMLLLFLLYRFEEFFGMPGNVILIFMGIAAALFVYSAIIFLVKPAQWQFYLKIIAFLNISYCLFTIYQLFENSAHLTIYGYIYFASEILVILLLSLYELIIATNIK